MQAARHDPQLLLSVIGSTQRSLQAIWAPGHSARQTPARHTVPERHALPQPPQLLGSRSVLTHTVAAPASPSAGCSQAVRPSPQLTSQVPLEQSRPRARSGCRSARSSTGWR